MADFIFRPMIAGLFWLCLALFGAAATAQEGPQRCESRPADAVFEQVSPAIVQITSFGVNPNRVAGRVTPGTGSGVLLADDLVLTNYHVVHAGTMIVVKSEGWSSLAEIVGADPALDIALLGLFDPAPDRPPEIDFVDYGDLRVGQAAYVIGYPLGLGLTLTSGIISGLDRKIPLNTISWTTRYIQTDAPVSPGNSGGALLDECGRMTGLVSLVSTHPAAENMAYALPMTTVEPIARELLKTGRVSRPWHGLYGQIVTPLISELMPGTSEPPAYGFLVETVEPGSAADKAGLLGGFFPVFWGNSEMLFGGDVILEVDGDPVRTLEQALGMVEALEIGSTVHLKVWRDGRIFETDALLEERPNQPDDLWVPPR